jgi:hypothetical protein
LFGFWKRDGKRDGSKVGGAGSYTIKIDLKSTYETLNKSKKFQDIAKKAGINSLDDFMNAIILGNSSYTDRVKGGITINEKTSQEEANDAIVHEITNRSLLALLHKLTLDVKYGVISPEDYAKKSLDIEAIGLANQVIVAKEAGYNSPTSAAIGNSFEGKKDSEIISEVSKFMKDSYSKIENDQGVSLITSYTNQGVQLQKFGDLMKSKKINTKERRKIDEKNNSLIREKLGIK